MIASLLYLLTCRVLAVVLLRFRSKDYKELEIVVLRQELATVLRRQVRRPELRTPRASLPGRGRPGGAPA